MMNNLYYPNTEEKFNVSLWYFLGDFDIYDREETLGEYLNNFDISDQEQLQIILKEKFFNGGRVLALNVYHKKVLIELLIEKLSDDNVDYSSYFMSNEDFHLPWNWELSRPRFFFEEVYRLSIELWGSELLEIGFVFPSLEELKIRDCKYGSMGSG